MGNGNICNTFNDKGLKEKEEKKNWQVSTYPGMKIQGSYVIVISS